MIVFVVVFHYRFDLRSISSWRVNFWYWYNWQV